MTSFFKQIPNTIKFLFLVVFISVFASACQKPIAIANKYAQKAEISSQNAETVEDWRAVDELWRQALLSLKDESSSEEISALRRHFAQGRLDALLEIALIPDVSIPCGREVSQSGREEPDYWGEVGYITVSSSTDSKLYQEIKESIEDGTMNQRNWNTSTSRVTPINPKQEVPLGTRIQIIRTELQHYGWGEYRGEILVRDIESKEEFWFNVLNFSLTDPKECLVVEDR